MICDWAARRNLLHKVEVLGFVDGRTSVDWIQRTGCRVINLLCKGSLKHCTQQLKKTPEEHIEDIVNVVRYADELDIAVNVYLEDWSNGMKDSSDYVFQLMDGLKDTSIKRYMLPDTLGILNPLQVIEFMRKMKKRYPHTHFDFHAHNDYDLAVSNVLAAVLSGVKGLHTTINGLGERAGNAPLASVQAILKDHFNALTNIDESRLNDVSRVVESVKKYENGTESSTKHRSLLMKQFTVSARSTVRISKRHADRQPGMLSDMLHTVYLSAVKRRPH